MPKRRSVVFEVVAPSTEDEPPCLVRAMLQHGEKVVVKEFESEVKAKEWIETCASQWVKRYRGGRYVDRSWASSDHSSVAPKPDQKHDCAQAPSDDDQP
jgi:hypothetical protein